MSTVSTSVLPSLILSVSTPLKVVAVMIPVKNPLPSLVIVTPVPTFKFSPRAVPLT